MEFQIKKPEFEVKRHFKVKHRLGDAGIFIFSDTGYFSDESYSINFDCLVGWRFFYVRGFWIRGIKGFPWTGSRYWNNLHGVLEYKGIVPVVRGHCVPALLQLCLGEQERAGSELGNPNFSQSGQVNGLFGVLVLLLLWAE